MCDNVSFAVLSCIGRDLDLVRYLVQGVLQSAQRINSFGNEMGEVRVPDDE
jgi:hypothetical protein